MVPFRAVFIAFMASSSLYFSRAIGDCDLVSWDRFVAFGEVVFVVVDGGVFARV